MTATIPLAESLWFSGLVAAPDADASAMALNRAVDELESRLRSAGGSLADVVQLTSFHTDAWAIEDDLRSVADRFTGDLPAWTPVGSTGCEVPAAPVALKAVANIGIPKQSITTAGQQWLRGLPIASGCRSGDLVFVSGQLATTADGAPAGSADAVAQARTAYSALGDVVAAFGGTFDDVLDFSHYLVDIRGGDATFKEVYMPDVLRVVGVERAATTTHVGTPALLRPGLIGAYLGVADLTPGQRSGSTPDSVWWKDAYPLAAATAKPGSAYVSVAGHVAATPEGEIAHPGDAEGQLEFILDGIAETLEGYGLGLQHIRELSVFAKEPRFAPQLRARLEQRFGRLPALSIVGSTGLWLEGFELEIAAVAIR